MTPPSPPPPSDRDGGPSHPGEREASPREAAGLVRGLGAVAATAIVITTVIGTGVFLKARVITCNVGHPGAVMAVWVAAGLLSLCGALTYAELAAMMPEAGGEYVFLRETYGRLWAFLYGWMQFVIQNCGSQAAKAIASAIFLNALTGGALDHAYFQFDLLGHQLVFGNLQVIALAVVALATLANCAAVSSSGTVASLLTALKLVLIVGVAAGVFLLARGDLAHFTMSADGGSCTGVSPGARGGLAGLGAAMLGALWAYDGWNGVTTVAGEVARPQRNLPIALIFGMALVMALYLVINAAWFYALSPVEVASVSTSSSVATEAVRRFLGPLAAGLMAGGMLASSLGSLHAAILTNVRTPFAMARDGLFFQSLSKLSPRTRVPVRALVVQAVWISLLVLSGSFDALTDYAMFAAWIFYGLVTSSVFVLRRRRRGAPRPYRTYQTWGYPVVPIVFLLVTGWLLANTILTAPFSSLVGLVLIIGGLPFYGYWAYWSRRARRAA